jgi:hypothetical protein
MFLADAVQTVEGAIASGDGCVGRAETGWFDGDSSRSMGIINFGRSVLNRLR